MGGRKYQIGAGTGKWGVVGISLYEADNQKYLVYTYSRENDSRIAVFDLQELKEIFVSKIFNGYDLIVGPTPLEGTEFTVSSLIYEEYEDGGERGEIIGTVGTLMYKNGAFQFIEKR